MRHLAKWSGLILAVLVAMPAAAADLEFNGYARAGVGLAAAGGGQVCFGLAGADTKYRLGNECDYTLEPTFTSRFVKKEDKSAWGIVVMPSLYRTYQQLTVESSDGADVGMFDNLPVRFGQIYLFGENIPELANGKIWGGRRFYDRLQTGINDQFLENEDGDGAGVEDMNVGIGKLSLAFLMNPNDDAHTYPTTPGGDPVATNYIRTYKVTARLTDLPTIRSGAKGALSVWGGWYTSSLASDAPDTISKPDDMYRIAVYHTLDVTDHGMGNNLFGGKVELGENHQLWRVVLQHGLMVKSLATGIDFLTEYRSAKNRDDEDAPWATDNWFTIGARTDTHISGPFRFLIEAGHDMVDPDEGDTQQLTKVTGAFAISSGEDPGSRPTIRIFYTHGFWNKAAQGDGGVYDHWQSGARLKEVYGNDTNGGSFGVQAEAWW
ncbi:MAG: carbohydrate porin [Anaeromyxobacter sp.]